MQAGRLRQAAEGRDMTYNYNTASMYWEGEITISIILRDHPINQRECIIQMPNIYYNQNIRTENSTALKQCWFTGISISRMQADVDFRWDLLINDREGAEDFQKILI